MQDSIDLWNLTKNEWADVSESHAASARLCCEFSPSGREMVVGGSIWNGGRDATKTPLFDIAENGVAKKTAELEVAAVYRAVINYDESMLAINCILAQFVIINMLACVKMPWLEALRLHSSHKHLAYV